MKEKIGFYSYVDLTLLTNAEIFDIITLVNRGVAQLVARLLWEQDAAGSNPVIRTIQREPAFVVGSFCFYLRQCNFLHLGWSP